VLDFETAGWWIRAIELAVVLDLSGAVRGPGWPRRAAAVARGGAWGERLTSAEVAALPDLILVRFVTYSAQCAVICSRCCQTWAASPFHSRHMSRSC